MGGSVPTIPGNKAEGELLQTLRREVANLLGRDKITFPGAQPVSFARRHIEELLKEDYFLCEKSDGVRVLMYCTNDGPQEVTYLIDRKNDYYHVPNLHFPVPDDHVRFHTDTLVDGELVYDSIDGREEMKYLIFDCLVLDGDSLMHRSLDKRIGYCKDRFFEPYARLYASFPQELQYLPFICEFKEMCSSYHTDVMFRDRLPNLRHGNDGLIFTARCPPYKFGTDEHILKWKTKQENSVDFRLTLEVTMAGSDSDSEDESVYPPYPDYNTMPTFHLDVFLDKYTYLRWGTMHVEPAEWASLKALNEPLDDRLVECYYDRHHRWRFLRFRDDKHEANHITTVQSVMESIEDHVTEADLISASQRIRNHWKARERMEKERRAEEAQAANRAPKRKAEGGVEEERRPVKMRRTPEEEARTARDREARL